jgi:hypothetical protein
VDILRETLRLDSLVYIVLADWADIGAEEPIHSAQ